MFVGTGLTCQARPLQETVLLALVVLRALPALQLLVGLHGPSGHLELGGGTDRAYKQNQAP